jgi:hypothetical protein
MEPNNIKPERPLWVRAGLLGLPTRGSALACFWLAILLAAACAIYGFWDPRFFLGILLVLQR